VDGILHVLEWPHNCFCSLWELTVFWRWLIEIIKCDIMCDLDFARHPCLGFNQMCLPHFYIYRFKHQGSDFSESASDDSSYSDSQPPKRRVTRLVMLEN
jgi:hypothetical protein